MPHRFNQLALVLIPLFLFVLAGCSAHATYTESLDTTAQVDPTQPVFLDIDIFRGSVTITEDPSRSQIEIKRSLHASRNKIEHFQDNIQVDPPLSDSLAFIDYQATYTPRHHSTRLPAWIITAVTSYPVPEYQWVDLKITAPALAGIYVHTSNGTVRITNAPAPLSVANDQGDITIKTNYPITQNIQLITANGDIELTIPETSTGTVNLDAGSGKATITNSKNQKSFQQEQARAYVNLNPGRNQIILQTTRGHAELKLTALETDRN